MSDSESLTLGAVFHEGFELLDPTLAAQRPASGRNAGVWARAISPGSTTT